MFDFKRMQPFEVLYDMTAFSDPQVRKTLAGKAVALFTTIYVKETSDIVMSVGDDISEHTINLAGDLGAHDQVVRQEAAHAPLYRHPAEDATGHGQGAADGRL